MKTENKPEFEYTLRMNSEQTHELLQAVELFMRLKLGQYQELPFALIPLNRKDFCERRDEANLRLKEAFRWMQGYLAANEYKDREWHVLYNILQAVRYQVHNAEHPDTVGVDSTPPVDIGEAGVPKCTYEVKSR